MANFNNIWKQISPKGDDPTQLRRSLARVSNHLSVADGVNIRPGGDVDTDLIVLYVTGTPTLSWDETLNQFVFSTGVRIVQATDTESFLRFKGTAASADLAKSIVDEGDVTTATRQGFVQVFVQDDGNQITDQKYYMPLFTLA